MKRSKGFTLIELMVVVVIVLVVGFIGFGALFGNDYVNSHCTDEANARMERYHNKGLKQSEWDEKYDMFFDKCMDRAAMAYDD